MIFSFFINKNKKTMEFTCCYYNINNELEESIYFIKQYNLIYIQYNDESSITISFEDLKTDDFIYEYYLLSKKLTPEPSKIFYENDKWSVKSYVLWKNNFILMNCFEFNEDPRNFILTKSSQKEKDEFYCNLKVDPLYIMNMQINLY